MLSRLPSVLALPQEELAWLHLAEPAFAFWDNPEDAAYDSPEGFLDDDPSRRGLRVHGVLIAIPSADRRTMRRILERCREAVVTMKIVPGLEALLSGRARVSEMREVRLEDLLRREPVRLDPSTIHAGLRGRRVPVTGPGGSIGSEIGRQVAAVEPALLVLLDRHEGGPFEIEAEPAEAHPAVPRASALVDIVERLIPALRRVVPEYEPIALRAGGNEHAARRAADGAAGRVPGACVTLVRPVDATNGGTGSDHARYRPSGA